MSWIRLFLLLLCAWCLAGCRNYPKQFRLMCTNAEEVQAELGTVANGVERHRVWANRIDPHVSGRARDVLLTIAGESLLPEQKYEILQDGAAECGVPNYRCDAIRVLFEHQARDRPAE